jgi:hypothetical protein
MLRRLEHVLTEQPADWPNDDVVHTRAVLAALKEWLPSNGLDLIREHSFLRNPLMNAENSPLREALVLDMSQCSTTQTENTVLRSAELALKHVEPHYVTFHPEMAVVINNGPLDELQLLDNVVAKYNDFALWVLPSLRGHFTGARNTEFRQRMAQALRLRAAPNLRAAA